MPFITSALSAGQLSNLRAETYKLNRSLAYCPNEVVFRCRPTSYTPEGTFAELNYTSVDIGAYTDVKVGMKVYVTFTSDLRALPPIFIGRVRALPTSSVLYINETGFFPQTSYYITVVNDYDLFPKLPRISGTTILIDWDITYTAPAPLITGLQSTYINPVSSGSASFAFAPSGTAIADGASISSWLWDVDDGSITVGTSTTQNITASFPQGHRWVRVTVTDSNGVTNYFVFEVYVGTTYIIPNVEGLSVSRDLEGGYSLAITGWHSEEFTDVFRSLLDATRITVFSTDYFDDGTTTPIVTNIDMVGRLRKEDSDSVGDEQFSNVQTVNFEIEGIGTQLARTSSQQLTFANKATPTVWNEVKNLTLTRAISTLITRYNNLSTLASVTFDDYSATIIKSINVETTSAGDALTTLSKYFVSMVNYAPSGEIQIARDALLIPSTDRGSLLTVLDFAEADMLEYRLDRDYINPVGQVQVGAERYNADGSVTYFTGNAPPEAQGNGEEIATLDGLFLESYTPNADAITELNGFVGAFYSYSQQPDILEVVLFDAWRNVLIPTCYQWYTFTLPSTSNIRGIPITSSIRWQLQSASDSYDPETGTTEISARFRREPRANTAQILSAIVPTATTSAFDPLPMVSPYSAFPEDPLTNYPTDTPDEDDYQPFNATDGYSSTSPLPAEEALPAGQETGSSPNCKATSVYFSNPSYTPLGRTLVNTETYNVRTTGMAKISNSFWSHTFDFTASDGGWSPVSVGQAFYTAGVGWTQVQFFDPTFSLNYVFVQINITEASPYTLTRARITYDLTVGSSTGTPGSNGQFTAYNFDASSQILQNPNTTGTNKVQEVTGNFTLSSLNAIIRASVRNDFTYGGGTVTVKEIYLEGNGTAPSFASTSATDLYSDAYYYFEGDGTTGTTQWAGAGFLIDAIQPSGIPPYSPTHDYTVQYVSDGTNPQLLFFQGDYSETENKPLIVEFCRVL